MADTKPKQKSTEQLLRELILEDARKTVEQAKRGNGPDFPDPVRPRWKN